MVNMMIANRNEMQLQEQPSKKVVICIPIYKNTLSPLEKASLKQLNKILGNYPRVFFAPETLDFDFGIYGEGIQIERFPDYYFSSVISYSALLLSKAFYQRFIDYEYMLVYQTDAFVFEDRLQEFCNLDYDYIGAPVEKANPFWYFIGGRVGNGGLSLRKISSALRMLEKWPTIAANTPLEGVFWQWEDIFWGYCGTKADLDFKVPAMKDAIEFAVQNNVLKAHKRMRNGWRPFGCHGWWPRGWDFWRPIIEGYGYDFADVENSFEGYYPYVYKYVASRKYVNVPYLWGCYKKGNYIHVLKILETWLKKYSEDHKIWQLLMEELIFMWRVMEYEGKLQDKTGALCKLKLTQAIKNSLFHGVKSTVCWKLLATLIPYLQKYDYRENKDLENAIAEKWWRVWSGGKQAYHHENIVRKRKIVVLSAAIDEIDLVESFVRHTLSFADAIMIDISVATDRMKHILGMMEKEGLPLVLHGNDLSPKRIVDGLDFVLSLSCTDFLLPQNPSDHVRRILEELPANEGYAVEVVDYAFYLPYVHQDKFALARPLVRRGGFAKYMITIRGCGQGEKKSKICDSLYIARFDDIDERSLGNGVIPADTEVTDISGYAMEQQLCYPCSTTADFRALHQF